MKYEHDAPQGKTMRSIGRILIWMALIVAFAAACLAYNAHRVRQLQAQNHPSTQQLTQFHRIVVGNRNQGVNPRF